MCKKVVNVILSSEAENFVRRQNSKAQAKITYNIRKIESGLKDVDILKKLGGSNIWEIRTLYNGDCYRLFAFWDTRTTALVVATHGIVKKTQKTPKKEIERAEMIRHQYYNNG